MAHTFSEFDRLPRTDFSIDELWFHSVRVGEFARQIASFEKQPSDVAEQAYAAGLLHDLGKVLFAANLPVPFGQALLLAKQQGLALHQAETQLFGANHAEVGASLLAIWDLPAPIVEAVALHHQPSLSGHKHFQPLAAVHAADVFAQRIVPGQSTAGISQLDQTYLAAVGLAERADLWRQHCEELDLSATC
jgi:HD-like signal output (HDOD) protein